MPWADVAPAIAARLGTVTDVGRVHIGDRHLRDEARVGELMGTPVPGQRDRIRGWRIIRTAIEEDVSAVGGSTVSENLAREKYVLRGLQGLADVESSERTFQELLDRVLESFRDVTTIGGAFVISGPTVDGVAYTDFGELTCHYAEISFVVQEYYSVTPVSLPVKSPAASAREYYGDAAAQLALYLSTVSGSGHVHAARPFGIDGADRESLFLVPSADDPTMREVRAWRVFRDGNAEGRGLGNLVDGESAWKVGAWRSWVDAKDTYDDFQRHIDAARAVIRGLPNLGNVDNPTLCLSSPLQVGEIGARMLMDLLTHYADCSIAVEEVVHA